MTTLFSNGKQYNPSISTTRTKTKTTAMSSTTSGNITILLPSRVPQSESELISGATSEFKAVTGVKIVSPGEVVSTDTSGYLKGHGTMVSEDGKYIVATVAGVVERVNKLLTVRPLKSRYFPSVGDVVVGRVVEVGNKRWKVDLQGRQNASLLLSAVYLPGGVQRRKTEEDLLQMRQLFTEQDVIVAEVQQIYHDSHIALQTRSAR
jgi:exosome complex component RRP4